MTWYTDAAARAAFGPTVRVENPGCEIGAGTVFEGSAQIGHDCVIGEDCVIGDVFYSAGNDFWAPGAPKPDESNGLTYDGDWDGFQVTYAHLWTDLAGLNNDLSFGSLAGGPAGNAITVAYVDPGAINRPLSVSVVESAITVSLSTGPTGAITATASTVMGALKSNPDASALISIVVPPGGDGTGVVTAMPATNLANGFDAIDIPWTIPTTIGDRSKIGHDCRLVAGTTIGDDNDLSYTDRMSSRSVPARGYLDCWGKPVIGNRNAFGAGCSIFNRAVVGDDNTFDGDCFIGTPYDAHWGTPGYEGAFNRFYARDFGDAKVGDRNTMGHDGYVCGPYANSASLGDDNVISFSFWIRGGHVTSGWTIGNHFRGYCDQEAVYGSDPAPYYYPTIIGTPDDSWCQQGGVAP